MHLAIRSLPTACFLAAERGSSASPSPLSEGRSRYTSNHDLANSRSNAKSTSQSTQLRAASSATAAKPPLPTEFQACRQTSRDQPPTRLPAQQAQPLQEEGSGYMDTESDSDTGATDKAQVMCLRTQISALCCSLFKRCVVKLVTHTACLLQRKPVSPGAQPIRDYKGQSRQMVTMASLEKGGYFDVPIQVNYM